MEETTFWAEFERDRPFIVGALFDALSGAMQLYPAIKLTALPRMADFARWGSAALEADDRQGLAFMAAYKRNIAGAVEEAVLSDTVGSAIVEFMENRGEWEGTATNLLSLLVGLPGTDTKAKAWPKRPHTLTRRIAKVVSALADTGIHAEISRSDVKRLVTLYRKPHSVKVAKIASLASLRHERSNDNGFNNDAIFIEASLKSESVIEASSKKPSNDGTNDANDANDASSSTLGGKPSGETFSKVPGEFFDDEAEEVF